MASHWEPVYCHVKIYEQAFECIHEAPAWHVRISCFAFFLSSIVSSILTRLIHRRCGLVGAKLFTGIVSAPDRVTLLTMTRSMNRESKKPMGSSDRVPSEGILSEWVLHDDKHAMMFLTKIIKFFRCSRHKFVIAREAVASFYCL